MTRYFFDVIGNCRPQYDFSGRAFADPNKAYQLADLLACDLEVGGDDEFAGGHISVRNERGDNLYSVPVRQAEAA